MASRQPRQLRKFPDSSLVNESSPCTSAYFVLLLTSYNRVARSPTQRRIGNWSGFSFTFCAYFLHKGPCRWASRHGPSRRSGSDRPQCSILAHPDVSGPLRNHFVVLRKPEFDGPVIAALGMLNVDPAPAKVDGVEVQASELGSHGPVRCPAPDAFAEIRQVTVLV